MPLYHPPICPDCLTHLARVNETEHNSYRFNPLTGLYDEDRCAGSLDISCPHCDADLADVFPDGACNHITEDTTPCLTPAPTT
jgi:hypothetical protein